MQELLSQLGIDWHLLLSQAVNFFILLVVLWYVAYKPLLRMLHDRRTKIEEGITKAAEADRRLREVDETNKVKVRETEAKAIGILKKTETDAKELEVRLMAEAKAKERAALANTEALLRAREDESRRAAEKEAGDLVRRAIVRMVEMAPEKMDDALIAKAVSESAGASKKTA